MDQNQVNQALPMVILDKGCVWEGEEACIVHWAEMEIADSHFSIPRLVEKQGEILRQEYLAWVHDLGECRLGGKPLKEHLSLGENSSFWWMTRIAEKSPIRSPGIYQVFKLRTVERLFESLDCCSIVLCSPNRQLHRLMSKWCGRLRTPYKWQPGRRPRRAMASLRPRIPQLIRALGTLGKYLCTRRWQLTGRKSVPPGDHQVTMVTYFPNIDNKLAEKGTFRSRYWEDLHNQLKDGPWIVNWLFVYIDNNKYAFKDSSRLLQVFNNSASGRDRYYFVDEFFSCRALLSALRRYVHLVRKGLGLRAIRNRFCFPGSSLNFWEILAEDWQSSIFGSVAMRGCLLLATWQALMQILPHQEWGLYLWENQPWEKALLWAWKDGGQGRLIGCQHTTLQFLDLRSFEDCRSYNGPYSAPIPDLLAVNGTGALKMLREVGFPENRQVITEALRYLYFGSQGSPATAELPKKKSLLVVTSVIPGETTEQLRLLGDAAQQGALQDYAEVMIKPHPFCPVDDILAEVSPELQVNLVNTPLNELWEQAAVVYAGNWTSAGLEAASRGLPVFVHLTEDSLNLSPLRNWPGAVFVATVRELVEALESPQPAVSKPGYFRITKQLTSWQKMLGGALGTDEDSFIS